MSIIASPGALRGYLANIDKVRVQGVELDSSFVLDEHFSGHFSSSYTAGKYVSYQNGPCPLELIGTSTTVCRAWWPSPFPASHLG